MSEEIPKVPPVATEDNVKNNDTVNNVPPAIATAPEVNSPTAGPGVTAAPSTPATAVIDTKTTRTRSKTTIQRQIKTNAMKYLMEEANKEFKITGIYTLPTEEKIGMECKKRWLEHEERGKAKEDVSSYFN